MSGKSAQGSQVCLQIRGGVLVGSTPWASSSFYLSFYLVQVFPWEYTYLKLCAKLLSSLHRLFPCACLSTQFICQFTFRIVFNPFSNGLSTWNLSLNIHWVILSSGNSITTKKLLCIHQTKYINIAKMRITSSNFYIQYNKSTLL